MEKDRIKAAIAIVDGANSIDDDSEKILQKNKIGKNEKKKKIQ